MSAARNTHIAWPPERFYFAVVDAPKVRRSHRWREQVRYAAEPQLPAPLEEVHSAIALGKDGRVIVCAAPREALAGLPPSAITLSPSELPEFLADEAAPEHFNLLTGAYESRRLRRLRRACNILTILAVLALGALVVPGFARRTAVLGDAAAMHEDAIQTVAQRVIEPRQDEQSTQQLFLQLTAELRGLRQTRAADIIDPELFDAPGILAAVLVHWPDDLTVRTESISVTRSLITLRADLSSSADVQRLTDALDDLPGWSLQQPRVNTTSGGGVTCTITFVRTEATP